MLVESLRFCCMRFWHLVINIITTAVVLITRCHNSMQQRLVLYRKVCFLSSLLMHGFTQDILRTRWIGFTTDGHSTTLGTGTDLHTLVREICPDITRAAAQITRLDYFLAWIFKTNNFFKIWSLINLIWIWFASFADFICNLEKKQISQQKCFRLKT